MAFEGKVFPCGRAPRVSADPFCGETPQRPLRARVRTGFAVTGCKMEERPPAPVAENRDVQKHPSRPCRLGPDQHLRRNYSQDPHTEGSRPGGWGAALGER